MSPDSEVLRRAKTAMRVTASRADAARKVADDAVAAAEKASEAANKAQYAYWDLVRAAK